MAKKKAAAKKEWMYSTLRPDEVRSTILDGPTHQQVFVLEKLCGGERSGAKLREDFEEIQHLTSKSAFYAFADRMVKAGWIKSDRRRAYVENYFCHEVVYSITKEGERVLNRVIGFYDAIKAAINGDDAHSVTSTSSDAQTPGTVNVVLAP
jgi:DNA-binding PadR family transcriptional regulator